MATCCSPTKENPWPKCCDGKTCFENWQKNLTEILATRKKLSEAKSSNGRAVAA